MKNVILFIFSVALFGMMSCEETALRENFPSDFVTVSNDKEIVDSTIESNEFEEQSNGYTEILECNRIDPLILHNLNINKYGSLHNELLDHIYTNNNGFILDTTEKVYDSIKEMISDAINSDSVEYADYIGVENIPSYQNAINYTSFGFLESLYNTHNAGLHISTGKSVDLINDIPSHVLDSAGKSIILNMVSELEINGNIIFQDYIDQLNDLNHSNSIFIGSIIISITSESVCFWENFFIEEDETKILPAIAGVAAVDCLGAIAGVWWKAGTDLYNGDYDVDQGEYGNAALGGAVTSSGFRLFGLK